MGAFKRPSVYDGGLQRPSKAGDILLNNLIPAALSVDAATLITAANMAAGLIIRTGLSTGRSDTLPTAALILATFTGMDIGDSFTVLYSNQSAQIATILTSTGITLTGTAAVPASTLKLMLFTVLSATTMRCDLL